MKLLVALILVSLFSCKTVSQRDLDLSKQIPIKGEPEAIGSYTSGCVIGAESLYPNETGLVVMRLNRGRYWGHPDLITTLREVGKTFRKKTKRDILVGDLGLAHGGPTITDHASHNSGLDVDIWMQSVPVRENNLSLEDRSSRSALSVVDKDNKIIDKLWGRNEILMTKLFAQHKKVQRVLINPYLKKYLCENKKRLGFKTKWLRKVRPWYGHSDHLHVRLFCPENSVDCKRQTPTPAHDDCNSENFKWWFTEEAQIIPEPFDPYERYQQKMKTLPQRCTDLLVK